MKIDNAHLTAFAEALSEGTFELAACKLNVMPSATSQRIKLLEERIGQILIQRTIPCQVHAMSGDGAADGALISIPSRLEPRKRPITLALSYFGFVSWRTEVAGADGWQV
jgi:hypothetical protein